LDQYPRENYWSSNTIASKQCVRGLVGSGYVRSECMASKAMQSSSTLMQSGSLVVRLSHSKDIGKKKYAGFSEGVWARRIQLPQKLNNEYEGWDAGHLIKKCSVQRYRNSQDKLVPARGNILEHVEKRDQ